MNEPRERREGGFLRGKFSFFSGKFKLSLSPQVSFDSIYFSLDLAPEVHTIIGGGRTGRRRNRDGKVNAGAEIWVGKKEEGTQRHRRQTESTGRCAMGGRIPYEEDSRTRLVGQEEDLGGGFPRDVQGRVLPVRHGSTPVSSGGEKGSVTTHLAGGVDPTSPYEERVVTKRDPESKGQIPWGCGESRTRTT